MRYVGSKRQIFKHLLPIILKGRTEGQYYAEPFCGGCNSLDQVTGPRIAGDVNIDLITYWKSSQRGWSPPTNITEEDYTRIKKSGKVSALRGYVGHVFSFGGKFFDTFARNERIKGSYKNIADFSRRGKAEHLRQQEKLRGVVFYYSSYENLPIPPRAIIYCDPPYRGVTHGYVAGGFAYQLFYDWCRVMKAKGHKIFISEYSMPPDFNCVWQKETKVNLNASRASLNRVEKLFTL